MTLDTKTRTNSEDETFQTGKSFSEKLAGGELVILQGDLGAGKTVFVKGMAAGQRSKDKPASPTFVLERIYSGNISIRHIDLYRSGPDRDILESIDEGIMNHDIVVVEWGDQLPLDYQKRAIHILISHDNHEDNARDIRIQEVTN